MNVERVAGPLATSGRPSAGGDRLKEACRQFEAMLLQQILKQSRAVRAGDGSLGAAGSIYEDLISQTLADKIAEAGVGLGDRLYRQLAAAQEALPRDQD